MPTPEEIQAAADAAQSEEESSEEPEELTADELKKQLADSQKKIRELNHESAERRKKLEAFEQAENERKQAELTEIEKVTQKLTAVEQDKANLAKENQTLKLQRAFEDKVRDAKLEFRSSLAAKDAFSAVVELLGDETEITDDHIKQLAKDRDYLFGKADTTTQRNDASAKGKANPAVLTQEQVATKKRTISPL